MSELLSNQKKEGDGDHGNCVSKDLLNNLQVCKQNIFDDGKFKNDLNNIFLLKTDLDKIKKNGERLLNNEYNNVNPGFIKRLTKEDLNENAAYDALAKQVDSSLTKDKLKNKHFDQNGDEDKTNMYIKADDKTAIEGTKTYNDLKSELDKIKSELVKIKGELVSLRNATKNAKIDNIRLIDDEGKVTDEASNSLAKKDDKVILKEDLANSPEYKKQIINDLTALGSLLKPGFNNQKFDEMFKWNGENDGLFMNILRTSMIGSNVFEISKKQAENIYNAVRNGKIK